jgi:lysophospholipase L1-like esterase
LSTLEKTAVIRNSLALAFGDSITVGYGLPDPANQNWFKLVCNYFNFTGKNFAVNSASYSNVNNSIASQVNSAINDTSFDNQNVRYVFLSSGINERNTIAAITAAIYSVVQTIKTNFPNATIYAMPLANSLNLNQFQQGDNVYNHTEFVIPLVNYMRTLTGVITFTESWKWLMYGEYTQNDTVHPNAAGARVIANSVINSLMGSGTQNELYYYSGDFNISDSIIDTANSKYYLVSNGYTWHIYGYMTLRAGQTIPANTQLFPTGNFAQNFTGTEVVKPFLIMGAPMQSEGEWVNSVVGYVAGRIARTYLKPITNPSSENSLKLYFDMNGSVGI